MSIHGVTLPLVLATVLTGCSDSGPTSASRLPHNEPSAGATSSPELGRANLPSSQPTDSTDDEEFNCTNVQKVRVRFGSPGFVEGRTVGLFAEFVGMPAAGAKLLRVWWDFEGDPTKYEDFPISDEVVPRDDGLFDWDGIVEHYYDVSRSTEFRVRIELVVVDQTGNCARVRDVTVAPRYRYTGTLSGPTDTAAGPEKSWGRGGGTPSGWTEDGTFVNFVGATHPVLVCRNDRGLAPGLHRVSFSATVSGRDRHGLDFFILSSAFTVGGVSAAGCRVYTR